MQQHAEQLTKEVQQYIEEPIEVKDQMHTPSLSFGIALYPEHAKKPTELAMKAEKALSIAERMVVEDMKCINMEQRPKHWSGFYWRMN